MLTDVHELPPFFNAEQVNATKESELPSLYPLKPTVNLDEVQVYDWETLYRESLSYIAAFACLV